MSPFKLDPILKQACAASASGFHNAGQMAIWSFSSVQLVVEDTAYPEGRPLLTTEEFSWFASLPLLMALFTSTPGGMLAEYLGPRKLQLLMAPVLALSSVALHLASWHSVQAAGFASTVLLLTRFIQSLGVGLAMSAICQYPCEIAESKHRGIVNGLISIWADVGYMMCYLTSYFFHWSTVTWLIPLMTFLPSFILLLISPESPVWLARKGRETKASEALYSLRNTKEEVMEELKALKNGCGGDTKSPFSFHLLKQKSNIKPLAIAAIMPIFRELSGNVAVTFFVGDIFRSAGVSLHPNLSSIIVASARGLSNLLGSLLLHRFPRKSLLIFGAIVVAFANAMLGTFCLLKYIGKDISYLNWLPLVILIIFRLGYGFGIGTLTWVVSIEILPNDVRSLGCGMTMTTYAGAAFVTTKSFHFLQDSIGLYGIFWIYSAAAFSYAIFTAIFIPETRGRTLHEMKEYWGK